MIVNENDKSDNDFTNKDNDELNLQPAKSNDKEENMDSDQERRIYAPDIESGKDITDITDVEKEDGNNIENKDKVIRRNTNFVKKKFAGEQNDDEMIENEQENRLEGSDKRIVVEKSPKERFARFDEELGAGAFKRVFRGYDYDTGREIAWNVVNVGCMSEDAITKIQEEIALIKKLKHPNIINFVSGFFNEGKKEVVIITEIFTSGSLKQYLNKIKHPRLKVIKFWCKEILKGLKYLHELPNPIIHRDIKCDNIFINGTTTEIKIGDLGYSCILRSNDYAKSVSGTPEFMAPEVLTGKYGVLADIYSFGICMLEIVTREKPYKECENNLIDIFENIKNHVLPKCIEKIKNVRLLEFIKSCLRPESERPSANDLLNSEFLNDLENEENNYPALMYPLNEASESFSTCQSCNSTRDLMQSGMIDKSFHKKGETFSKFGHTNKECSNFCKSNKEFSSPAFKPRNIIKDEKLEDKIISPFEINSNNSKKSATPKNKMTILPFSNKRLPEIVGLRNKQKINSNTEMNFKVIKENQLSKKSDNMPHNFNSSSEDYEDLTPNDKFQYDPSVVKVGDTLISKAKVSSSSSNLKKLNVLNSFSAHIKTLNMKNPLSSKIEIKIEEEYKVEKAIKISLVKKEKPKHKGQKISFKFDLNNDTCEKIVKELENEKIGLNEEEKKIFTQKLSNLIKNYSNSITKNNETSPPIIENKNLLIETKLHFDKFLNKYNKIIDQSEEIIQGSKEIKEELLGNAIEALRTNNEESHREFDEAKHDFIEKMKILEEFLKLR